MCKDGKVKKEVSALEPKHIQVDDKVYSASALASVHPGGDLFVKAFAGRDATDAFISYHRRRFPHSKMEAALVRSNVPAAKKAGTDDDYLQLCELVDKIIPRNKSFGTLLYFVKVFCILASAFALEYYIHSTRQYVWYLTGVLGFLFALIGLNIQHDSNHGAASRYPIVNRLLGMSQNWIGGSAIDWIHQHVVQHHVATNEVHGDPDLSGNDMLRVNPLKPLLAHHPLQFAYIFVVIAGFGFSVVYTSLKHTITGFHFSNMSSMLQKYRVIDILATSQFLLRWIVLPMLLKPSISTFINIAPMFMVGGYYLAFFFVISHNFEGVHIFDKSNPKMDDSFLYTQVASSSNVGGAFLGFINGGLNYQIEHHLFPRMNHSHYPIIAPHVRKFCQERNIPYVHFPTVLENAVSCSKYLYYMGRDNNKVVYGRNK